MKITISGCIIIICSHSFRNDEHQSNFQEHFHFGTSFWFPTEVFHFPLSKLVQTAYLYYTRTNGLKSHLNSYTFCYVTTLFVRMFLFAFSFRCFKVNPRSKRRTTHVETNVMNRHVITSFVRKIIETLLLLIVRTKIENSMECS